MSSSKITNTTATAAVKSETTKDKPEAAIITTTDAKGKAKTKKSRTKTHDESAVEARAELAKVCAGTAARFKNLFNKDTAIEERVIRPYPTAPSVCICCERPFDDASAEGVSKLISRMNPEVFRYVHTDCLACQHVVDVNSGKHCGEVKNLFFSTTPDPTKRVNMDRNGRPVCFNHADDHALDIPCFAESEVDKQRDFLDKYGFVKVRPDAIGTPDFWVGEHERVIHGMAVTHGFELAKFKKRVEQPDWAVSYIDEKLLQEKAMFGIFGVDNANRLQAPFVQSREAYAVRSKYTPTFANLLYDPKITPKQMFASGPCPYIMIPKEASGEYPVSSFNLDKKHKSEDRARPLLMMTGFTFFGPTSRRLGGVQVVIGAARPTQKVPKPFPVHLEEAYPRSNNLGQFDENNSFVGSTVAVPTQPGEVVIIRADHPYRLFSGSANQTGMFLAVSDMTLKDKTMIKRAQPVLEGVVRPGDVNRTVIKYPSNIRPAPEGMPMSLPGVFTPVTDLRECAVDVFGTGHEDPSTWPEAYRPRPVPVKADIQTKKSQMSETQFVVGGGSAAAVIVDEEDEFIDPVPVAVVEAKHVSSGKKKAVVSGGGSKKKEEKPVVAVEKKPVPTTPVKPVPEKKLVADQKKKKPVAKEPSPEEEEQEDEEQEGESGQDQGGEEKTSAKKKRGGGGGKKGKVAKIHLDEGEINLLPVESELDQTEMRTINTLNRGFMTQENQEVIQRVIAARLSMASRKTFKGEVTVDEGVVSARFDVGGELENFTLQMTDAVDRLCDGDSAQIEALAKETRRILKSGRALPNSRRSLVIYGGNPIKGMKNVMFLEMAGAVQNLADKISPQINRVSLIAGCTARDFYAEFKGNLSIDAAMPSFVLSVGNSARVVTLRKSNLVVANFVMMPGMLVELPGGLQLMPGVAEVSSPIQKEAHPNEEPWGLFHFYTADPDLAIVNESGPGAKKKRAPAKKKVATATAADEDDAPAAAAAEVSTVTAAQRGKLHQRIKDDLGKLQFEFVSEFDNPEHAELVAAFVAARGAADKKKGDTALLFALQDAFAALHLAVTGKTWSNGRKGEIAAAAAAPAKKIAPASSSAGGKSKGKASAAKKQKRLPTPSDVEDSSSNESNEEAKVQKEEKERKAAEKANKAKTTGKAKPVSADEDEEEEGEDQVADPSLAESNLGAKSSLAGIPKKTQKYELHVDGTTVVRRSTRDKKSPGPTKADLAVIEENKFKEDAWKASEKKRKTKCTRQGKTFVPLSFERYKELHYPEIDDADNDDNDDEDEVPKGKRGRGDDNVYDKSGNSDSDSDSDSDSEHQDDEDDDESDPIQIANDTFDEIQAKYDSQISAGTMEPEAKKLYKAARAAQDKYGAKDNETTGALYVSAVDALAARLKFKVAVVKDEDVLYGKASRGVGTVADVPLAGLKVVKKGFNADVDLALTSEFVDKLLLVCGTFASVFTPPPGDYEKRDQLKEFAEMMEGMRNKSILSHARFSADVLRRFIDLSSAILRPTNKKKARAADVPVPVASAASEPVQEEEPAAKKTKVAAADQEPEVVADQDQEPEVVEQEPEAMDIDDEDEPIPASAPVNDSAGEEACSQHEEDDEGQEPMEVDAPAAAAAAEEKEEEEDNGEPAAMIEDDEDEPIPAAVPSGPESESDPTGGSDDEEEAAAPAPVEKEEEEEEAGESPEEEEEAAGESPEESGNDKEEEAAPEKEDDQVAAHPSTERVMTVEAPVTKSPAKPSVEPVYLVVMDTGRVFAAERGEKAAIQAAKDRMLPGGLMLPMNGSIEDITKVRLAPNNWRDILRAMNKAQEPKNLIGMEISKLFPGATAGSK